VLIGVVIPRGFGKDLEARHRARCNCWSTAAIPTPPPSPWGTPREWSKVIRPAVRGDVINRKGMHPPGSIDARIRVWYNSSLESKNFVVPGLIGVILVILAGQLTSLTIAREWEMGTMEQVLSTPLRPAEIVLGKMMAYFRGGAGGCRHRRHRGHYHLHRAVPRQLPGAGRLHLRCFCGARSSRASGSPPAAARRCRLTNSAFWSFLPGFLLSGFTFSLDTMPKFIQGLSYFFPARYYVTIVKGVFLKGIGFRILWVEMAFLVLYGTLIFWRTVRKMNQKVA
jgi:ABC-2 type transport system permease protein